METWKTTVQLEPYTVAPGVEVTTALGNWSLGDAPVFYVDAHPWLPSGGYRRRIVGYQNASPTTVTLELNETLGVS
jgi:hypothetical protein